MIVTKIYDSSLPEERQPNIYRLIGEQQPLEHKRHLKRRTHLRLNISDWIYTKCSFNKLLSPLKRQSNSILVQLSNTVNDILELSAWLRNGFYYQNKTKLYYENFSLHFYILFPINKNLTSTTLKVYVKRKNKKHVKNMS